MREELIRIVAEQQSGEENTPIFMIGEQLKEIAEGDDVITDLLIKDLQTDGMKLADAAKELQSYSDKNRKGAKVFCISPKVAEGILRKFYGLPDDSTSDSSASAESSLLDLSSFF